jgi:hypothetical protein
MKVAVVLGGAALALLLPAQALAACDTADFLLKKAYPEAQTVDGALVVTRGYRQSIDPGTVVCKTWPFRPELTLVAVPLLETDPPVDGERKGDVEIIVTDTDTGEVIARRLEKGMAFADAIQFGSLSLDTARYDLVGDRRAFGLRTVQSGSSRVNPYEEQALWLYTFDKERIGRVLDGLIVERSNGENNGDCEGTSTAVKRSVTLGAKKADGYRDLVIDQSLTLGTSSKAGDDCKWTEKPGAKRQVVLHFADGRYQPPAGVKARSEDGDVEQDLFSLIAVDAPKP